MDQPILLTDIVIKLDEIGLDISGLKRYEDIVVHTVKYALTQFSQGLYLFSKKNAEYPIEDRVTLHSYLRGVAPFMHLTRKLIPQWEDYAKLFHTYEDENSPFSNNFTITVEDVESMKRYLESHQRQPHGQNKHSKRSFRHFGSDKYFGAKIKVNPDSTFDLKEKIRFLERSSQFDDKTEGKVDQLIYETLHQLHREYDELAHILAYALMTELGPVCQVDVEKHFKGYDKMVEIHKEKIRFMQNFRMRES